MSNHQYPRIISTCATLCVATLIMSGCSGGQSPTSAETSDGPITLRIAWWGSNSRLKITEEALDSFEKAHPNITVETENTDWGGYWDRLATEMAGGSAPDVIQMDELYLASYASQGSLYDLGKAANYIDYSGMDPSLADMGKVNGTQYAVPASYAPFAIGVNNGLLKTLGLTLPDTSNWTWDDLIAFAKQIRSKSNGTLVAITPMSNGYSLQLWARQHDEALFADGKVAISQATLASYLQMAYDWTHGNEIAGAPDQWAENSGGSIDQSNFGTNKQVLSFVPATQIEAYAKAAGSDDFSLVAPPSVTPGQKYAYLKSGINWSVSATSEHPAEAAMLIDYLVNDQNAGKILGTERGLPSNNAIRKTLSSSASGMAKVALDYVDQVESAMGKAPEITPNGASDLDKLIARVEQDVAFGRQSANDAAQSFINELSTAIASA